MNPIESVERRGEARHLARSLSSSDASGPLRLLAVGASSTSVCGVRDYAGVMEQRLREQGTAVTTLWWERDERWSPRATVREARRWLSEVGAIVAEQPPDCILWHYSVFVYGWRGIPLAAPVFARELARTGRPVVAVLHEFAFPLGRRGWRGTVHAVTQRIALVPTVQASNGVVVTTKDRLDWIRRRPWLPRKPLAFAPVYSNLPQANAPERTDGEQVVIGVFGFRAEDVRPELVTQALARLLTRGIDARLVLVGAPGAPSREASIWRAAAAAANCADAVSFTGVLDPLDLAAALSALDIVVLADKAGPTSRRTTLAAALAEGKAVVAFDGPKRWDALVRERAVVTVPQRADELAAELESLARDGERRRAQGARAATFYRRHMTPDVVVDRVLRLVRSVARPPAGSRA